MQPRRILEETTSIKIIKWIRDYTRSNTKTYFAKDVVRHVDKQLGIGISKKTAISIMKNNLSMTYKKVTPRVASKTIEELNMMRKIFILDLAQQIENIDYFISIDECIINRYTYHGYGWMKKGSITEYN